MQQAGKSDDLPDTGDEVACELLSAGSTDSHTSYAGNQIS